MIINHIDIEMNELNKYIYVIDSFKGILRQYLYIYSDLLLLELTANVKSIEHHTQSKFSLISNN